MYSKTFLTVAGLASRENAGKKMNIQKNKLNLFSMAAIRTESFLYQYGRSVRVSR
jgi:hypothetical protein